jgi:hypothetical protein
MTFGRREFVKADRFGQILRHPGTVGESVGESVQRIGLTCFRPGPKRGGIDGSRGLGANNRKTGTERQQRGAEYGTLAGREEKFARLRIGNKHDDS